MIELKNRQWREIEALLEARAPQTVAGLARALGIKERTLRADLPVVASYCGQWGATLSRDSRGGVSLGATPEVRSRLREAAGAALDSARPADPRQRQRRMLIRCLVGPKIPTLDQWSEELGVSRPTVVKDVRAVREWLAERRLGLVGKAGVGYSLVGQEFDLRNALVQLLLQGSGGQPVQPDPLHGVKEVLGEFDLSPAREFLDQLQASTRVQLVEQDYLGLLLYIAVTVLRLRHGHPLPEDLGQLSSLLETDEHKLVEAAVPHLERAYGVSFSPSETAHLSLSFICAKKLAPRPACGPAQSVAPTREAEELAREVIREAEEIFGVALSQDRDFVRLLATHIGITLRKLRFGLPVETEGPTEYLKREHPLAFGLGLSFCDRLSQRLGVRVPAVEATFIAMHIAAGLEKVKYRLRRRQRVALVCTTAMSASTFLFWQLTNSLPEVDVVQVASYDDVVKGRMNPEVDLIVSTVPLPAGATPVVVISPLFTGEDRRRIVEALRTRPEQDPLGAAGHLLDPRTILLQRSFPHARALLEEVGEYLTRKRFARKGFTEALVEREARFGSAINTPVPMAMPHAGPAFTRRTTVLLLTLNRPVPFNLVEDPGKQVEVRLVLVPVLTVDDVTGMRFYELLSVVRKGKLARAILGCRDPAEVIRLIGTALAPRT